MQADRDNILRIEAPGNLRKALDEISTILKQAGPFEFTTLQEIREKLMPNAIALKTLDIKTYEKDFKEEVETLTHTLKNNVKWAPLIQLERARKLLEDGPSFIDTFVTGGDDISVADLIAKFRENGFATTFFDNILMRYKLNPTFNTDYGLKTNNDGNITLSLAGLRKQGSRYDGIDYYCDYHLSYKQFMRVIFRPNELFETIALAKIFRVNLFREKKAEINKILDAFELIRWRNYFYENFDRYIFNKGAAVLAVTASVEAPTTSLAPKVFLPSGAHTGGADVAAVGASGAAVAAAAGSGTYQPMANAGISAKK